MATELAWETLFATMSGSQQYDAQAEFKNDSSQNISIRKIRHACEGGVLTDDDTCYFELSTDPTYSTSAVTGDGTFRYPIVIKSIISTNGGLNAADNGGDSYGKGQLVLRPGESLYANALLETTSTSGTMRFVIGYQFV